MNVHICLSVEWVLENDEKEEAKDGSFSHSKVESIEQSHLNVECVLKCLMWDIHEMNFIDESLVSVKVSLQLEVPKVDLKRLPQETR